MVTDAITVLEEWPGQCGDSRGAFPVCPVTVTVTIPSGNTILPAGTVTVVPGGSVTVVPGDSVGVTPAGTVTVIIVVVFPGVIVSVVLVDTFPPVGTPAFISMGSVSIIIIITGSV